MNCCANLSNLVIYRALLSDPIVNALRRPKEFFAPELEGLLLVAAEEKRPDRDYSFGVFAVGNRA